MKKITLSLVLCVFCTISFAQRQASNWYFGYGAGVQFDLANNAVNPVNNGLIFTNEGCSSISDEGGNLLFYTDGTIVWNKNHTQMLNGAGLFGDNSSTQSAIIVPKPDDENIYYIFTVDTTIGSDPDFGFNYSIVDMTLDGGLGGVSQKNTNLLKHCSEKITAVLKDCITKSIWVITLASENGDNDIYNTFHAYEVSNTGVSTASVKSTFPSLITSDKRGYLKLSPDGTKIACANVRDGLHIYDFNTDTGKATNLTHLTVNSQASPYPYGVEFSPNSELLYVHAYNNFFDFSNATNNNNPSNHTSVLTQFNMKAPDIQNSQVIIDDRNLYRGALQLGPNGKIYRALSATYEIGLPFLGVINNPNGIGLLCDYQHNAVSISPNNSSQGLPPFISSFFNTQIDIIKNGRSSTNLDLCDGESYTLTSVEIPGATYSWTLNGAPLAEADHNLLVTQNGYYEVYIDPDDGDCTIVGDAFVTFNPNPIAHNHTILQCDDDSDGFTLFNLNEANISLTNGDSNLSTKFYANALRTTEINGDSYTNTSNPQIVYVEVIDNATNCVSNSELTLQVSVTNTNKTTLTTCDDDGIEDGLHIFNLRNADTQITNSLPTGIDINIVYYQTYEDALLEQNSLGDTYTNSNPFNQIIFARVENTNNCYGISELELIVNKLPEIETNTLAYYCLNFYPTTIPINAGPLNGLTSNFTYAWNSGEDTYEININKTGTYKVTITNGNGCSKTRTIIVEASNIATINNIDIDDAKQNNIITIHATGEGEYQYQLLDENNIEYKPFQNSNVFENVFPGIYSIKVKDVKKDCGPVFDNFSVIGFPKFFTPNNDGKHDTWQIYGVSSMFQANTKIQIFDRYGKLIKEILPNSEGWDGSFNGQKLPTDDYWFYVKLQDGRIFKDHFTLKN